MHIQSNPLTPTSNNVQTPITDPQQLISLITEKLRVHHEAMCKRPLAELKVGSLFYHCCGESVIIGLEAWPPQNVYDMVVLEGLWSKEVNDGKFPWFPNFKLREDPTDYILPPFPPSVPLVGGTSASSTSGNNKGLYPSSMNIYVAMNTNNPSQVSRIVHRMEHMGFSGKYSIISLGLGDVALMDHNDIKKHFFNYFPVTAQEGLQGHDLATFSAIKFLTDFKQSSRYQPIKQAH